VKKLAFMAIALLLFSGCDQQKSDQIQWQMPLQASDDPHGSHTDTAMPEWAAAQQGEAEVVWLQKNTTRTVTTKLVMGGNAMVQDWKIRLLGLASGLRVQNKAFLNDKNVDNPAAFVEVSHDSKVVYRGWLYAKFPELFGMDDPEWKIWLKGITIRPAS